MWQPHSTHLYTDDVENEKLSKGISKSVLYKTTYHFTSCLVEEYHKKILGVFFILTIVFGPCGSQRSCKESHLEAITCLLLLISEEMMDVLEIKLYLPT